MEEMMMVMKITPQETSQNHHHHHNPNHNIKIPIITTTTCPTWKLYENPFYTFHNQQQQQQQQISTTDQIQKQQQIHRLHLPISSKKIAASFWDLTFMKPIMEAEINDVRAELEHERKARKKMDSLNKRLARELSEERRGREALERVCEELAREISADKAEISRMRREIEDERKMLRTAEVIREERVQMKLSDAKNLLEEKLSELQTSRNNGNENRSSTSSSRVKKHQDHDQNTMSFGEKLRFVLGEKRPSSASASASACVNNNVMQRRSSGETENPHIKRGIKGFVEFPKVVRAIGCRSRSSSSKLECQKAQLKILLKQKGTLRFNGLITR